MNPDLSPPTRPVVTPSQLRAELGTLLLRWLHRIFQPRKLTHEEVQQVEGWLIDHRSSEFFRLGFVTEVVEEAILRGSIAESDLLDLYLAVERVLPVTAWQPVADSGGKEISPDPLDPLDPSPAAEQARQKRERWATARMTDSQWKFIEYFRGSISPTSTQGEAAHLITRLLADQPITLRLELMARFWGREFETDEGPREVLAWMEAYLTEDADRKRAWDLFRDEGEAAGFLGDPSRLPSGLGPQYLARIKSGGGGAIPQVKKRHPARAVSSLNRPTPAPARSKPTSWRTPILSAVTALVIAGAIVWFGKSYLTKAPAPLPSSAQSAPKPGSALASAAPASSTVAPSTPAPADDALTLIASALNLEGVTHGQEPSALIDGRLYRVGDVVDSPNKIRIIWIDEAAGTVTFGDPAGHTLTRRPPQ